VFETSGTIESIQIKKKYLNWKKPLRGLKLTFTGCKQKSSSPPIFAALEFITILSGKRNPDRFPGNCMGN
jgi:hypothetical protein